FRSLNFFGGAGAPTSQRNAGNCLASAAERRMLTWSRRAPELRQKSLLFSSCRMADSFRHPSFSTVKKRSTVRIQQLRKILLKQETIVANQLPSGLPVNTICFSRLLHIILLSELGLQHPSGMLVIA